MDTETCIGRHSRVSWAGIWAGLFAGLGVQIMLTALGVGIGLKSSGASATDFIRNLPAGVELWSGLVWLFSAFLGGYVAAWMSGAYDRADGVFHGFVTWGVMTAVLFDTALMLMAVVRLTSHVTVPMTPLVQAATWWVFWGGILSLGCAYLGGRIGVRAAEHSIGVKGAQRAA
jgi:hypothetical protein